MKRLLTDDSSVGTCSFKSIFSEMELECAPEEKPLSEEEKEMALQCSFETFD